MINHPNRSSKFPAERFLGVLDELKATTGLCSRILWESSGPKSTGIAYHGGICLLASDGTPCGVAYLQIFKSENGFEIFLGAPGNNKPAGFAWIKRSVTGD